MTIDLSSFFDDGYLDIEKFDTPEKREFGAQLLSALFSRVSENVNGNITSLDYRDGKLSVESEWESYRCGSSETHRDKYEFPIDTLYDSTAMYAYLAGREAAIKAKEKAEAEASEKARKRSIENEERRQFERLAKKFSAVSEGNQS